MGIKGNTWLELLLFPFECFVFLCKTVSFVDCPLVSVDDGIPHSMQAITVTPASRGSLRCKMLGAQEQRHYESLLCPRDRGTDRCGQ
jgi:hypothetical protein